MSLWRQVSGGLRRGGRRGGRRRRRLCSPTPGPRGVGGGMKRPR